jgi:N-acetyl-anhydromuramyl-L-alanine amidase AmpD
MTKRTLPTLLAALYAATTIACAGGPGTSPPPAVPVAVPTQAAGIAQPVVAAQSTAVVVATPTSVPTVAPTPDAGVVKARATPIRTPQTLQYAFEWSAKEFGVPLGILLAVSYDETRWEQHHGEPSTSGGYGVMHLTDVPDATDPSQHTLQTAVKLLNAQPASPFHVTADELKTDYYQNVRGGAALLAQYAEQTVGKGERANEADWYGAVAKYAGAKDAATAMAFADQVYAALAAGASVTTTDGQPVHLTAKNVIPNKTAAAPLTIAKELPNFTPECPADLACTVAPTLYQWRNSDDPTDIGNYEIANRPENGLQIKYIVIHDAEGTVKEAIRGFQAPGDSSANYIISSQDGSITQLVPIRDVAFHSGNWYFNNHSIGIEHEGYAVEGATWYSEPMYQASAKLVRYLAQKYNIPLDRAHILGHDNIPGLFAADQAKQHWDPGPYWDWNHYLELLGAPIKAGTNPDILTIKPDFAKNVQTLASSCTSTTCKDLPAQGSNFLWVHAAPDANSPLIADPATASQSPLPGQGTRLASDWGDQVVTGEKFFRVATQADWEEIDIGGQIGWINDPGHQNTVPGDGILVRTRTDRGTLIPVYGHAFPELQVYPTNAIPDDPSPLTYIGGGQTYVAIELVSSDDWNGNYKAKTPADNPVVKGQRKYYEIYFNHRLAFLSPDDVQVVSGPGH